MNDIIKNLKPNKKNYIITQLPILANNKLGSYLKSIFDKAEKDDSTNIKNIDNVINFLDKIREKKYDITFIAGDAHLSSNTDISYKGDFFAKQLISSGLSESCTINSEIKMYLAVFFFERLNFGSYNLKNYKSKINRKNFYDTNYLIIDENNKIIEYMKNRRTLSTSSFFQCLIIMLLIVLFIFLKVLIIKKN